MFHFLPPKVSESQSFLIILGGIEMDDWFKMGQYYILMLLVIYLSQCFISMRPKTIESQSFLIFSTNIEKEH